MTEPDRNHPRPPLPGQPRPWPAFDPSRRLLEDSQELLDVAATRSAILSVTRSLARQPGEQGIRVNAVTPGP